VIRAREIQEERYQEFDGIYCNAQMNYEDAARGVPHRQRRLTVAENRHGESWTSRPGPTTGFSRFRAPLPTWMPSPTYGPSTWPKPFTTAAWTGRAGQEAKHYFPERVMSGRIAAGISPHIEVTAIGGAYGQLFALINAGHFLPLIGLFELFRAFM
jgi:hypothetical protein